MPRTQPTLKQIAGDGDAATKNVAASGDAGENEVVLGGDSRLVAHGRTVAQTAHNLVVGDVVRHNGTIFVKAQANTAAGAEVVGVVDSVADADNFHLALPGDLITTLSGLTPGDVYFLSHTTAGLLVATDSPDGTVSKPVLLAISATSGVMMNSRGVYKVAGSNPTTDVFNEPPSGELNGVNDTFTLEFAPDTNSLRLYLNGVRREVDTDFTLSGVTIVFVVPPVDGSILLADYSKA